jgi:tRNA1Val (adenine37-N6)-methyltransferase
MADRALRSVKFNRLEEKVEIIRGDVRLSDGRLAPRSFDIVVSNPPYRRLRSGRTNPDPERHIARHEVKGTLQDFLSGGSRLLRPGGRMDLVYPATRAVDLIVAMREEGLEPKRLRLVHSYEGGAAALVLVEGIKDGGAELQIERPLVIYAKGKEYTPELKEYLAGRRSPSICREKPP